MADDVRRDRLSRHRTVLQRVRGHRSGTDDIVAAWSAWRAAPGATRVLDLGAGHGTVTLLLSQLLEEARFVCVEAQEVSADLCRRNIEENGLGDRVEVIHADLRSLGADLGRFDLVTGTPPFMRPGSGVLPQDPQRAAARFELRGGIEDYCAVAARHGDVVSMVMDGQEDRARAAFAAAGLPVARVTRVRPRQRKAPTYVACVGPGPQSAEPEELVVRAGDGWSAEWSEVREALALD